MEVLFLIVLFSAVGLINWIYYRNIKKNPINQIDENMIKARRRLKRADDYLLGSIGFGNSNIKSQSANGAFGLAIRSFEKAIDHYNQFSQIHHDIGTSDEDYDILKNKIIDKFEAHLKAISYSNSQKNEKILIEVQSDKAKAILDDWRDTVNCLKI